MSKLVTHYNCCIRYNDCRSAYWSYYDHAPDYLSDYDYYSSTWANINGLYSKLNSTLPTNRLLKINDFTHVFDEVKRDLYTVNPQYLNIDMCEPGTYNINTTISGSQATLHNFETNLTQTGYKYKGILNPGIFKKCTFYAIYCIDSACTFDFEQYLSDGDLYYDIEDLIEYDNADSTCATFVGDFIRPTNGITIGYSCDLEPLAFNLMYDSIYRNHIYLIWSVPKADDSGTLSSMGFAGGTFHGVYVKSWWSPTDATYYYYYPVYYNTNSSREFYYCEIHDGQCPGLSAGWAQHEIQVEGICCSKSSFTPTI